MNGLFAGDGLHKGEDMGISLFRISVLILAAALLAAGCGIMGDPHSGPVVHSHDSSTKVESGEKLDLVLSEFTWRYFRPLNQIKLVGQVENIGPEGLQGIRIIIEAFDQFDDPLGKSESFLIPTYIAPGQLARFDAYFQAGDWVEAIHLSYSFEKRY